MPLVLCRVDDRLIHGQVVIGWGRPLGVRRILLVDDDVASNAWEQDLYRMAVPDGIELVFSDVAGAASHLAGWQAEAVRSILLTGRVETVARLFAADPVAMHRINLGGVHHRPGRTERLPYLYLTDDEYRTLAALESEGADVTAQDVPSATPVGLKGLK
jgi:PTS system mannose-specific IIB component/fructoselysine and glucoselysine-specific PTS system IIB component